MLRTLRHRLRALRAGERLDGQLDRELEFHIDLQTRKLVDGGLSPEAARTAALRQFGGVERVREECRDTRGVAWAEGARRAISYAVRTLRRQPGFTFVSVLVLGLGIGANTAMFSLIQGVLLKPLPYADGDQLVLVRESAALAGQDNVGVSIPELYDYRKQLTGFSGLVEFHQMSFDLLERGEPDRVATGVVSANFFDVLGVRPVAGRTFVAADEAPGAPAVLVLSHAYWRTRFGGDPKIVGQVFQMNDRPHTVVGVLPQIPQYPAECDVYMPTSACPFRAAAERRIGEQRRAFGALQVFGRLKRGVSLREAQAAVATVAGRFRQDFPQVYRSGQGFDATAVDLLQELTHNARPMLLVLLAATGLVLLIACANIASLSLARALNRDREFALRAALGAGRRQLAAQLLTESLILALAGGAVGVAIAWATLDALARFAERFTPRVHEIALDGGVLAFTLALSLLTGLAFGAIPALMTRPAPAAALKQAGAGGTAPRRRRLQHALVVAQVSVSVVLLVGAGLFLASVVRLQRVDAGYRPDRVLSAEVFGNFSRYENGADLLRLYEPLVARLAAEPGVVSAAISSAVPLGAVQPFINPFEIEGQVVEDPDRRPTADYFTVSNDYFDTLAIPVLRGRGFQTTDTRESTRVAVISRSMARYWDTRDPIGTRVSVDRGETWLTVVGVVGDVRQRELDREPIAQMYTALSQTVQGLPGRVLVRTAGDPIAMAAVVRSAVRAIDPTQTVENMQTLDEVRSTQLATPRLTAMLLTLFAGLALLVTLAGIGGVIATMVAQRTQEFGIRMALGASRGAVLKVVLVQGLSLVCAGLVLGLIASSGVTRLLSKYLFETQPTDAATLALVALTCIVAGAVACLGPARRAVSVDPIIALRTE